MKLLIPSLLAAGVLALPVTATAQDQSKDPAPTEMQKERQNQSVPPAPSDSRDQGSETAAPEVDIVTIDVIQVARGYRASKVIGDGVYNDAGDKIGSVDDLIVRTDDKVVYAIVSVGGFLGIGERLIAVPYEAFRVVPKGDEERVVLPGATKEQLQKAPEFKYGKEKK